MSRNKQPSEVHPSDEVGIVLDNPRSYRWLRAALLLRRSRPLYRELATLTRARRGDDAADIGCGPGDLVAALADCVGPDGSVVGIDPSPEMNDHATAHARPNSRFERAAAQDLPLSDESVDVVTSTFVMHHIPQADRDAALAGMFRVLRPGGTVLLADAHPSGPILPILIRAMSRSAARHTSDGVAGHADPIDAIDIRRYIPDLTRQGFTSVEFRTVGSSTGALVGRKPGRAG